MNSLLFKNSFHWEYLMDKSIWMKSCSFLFLGGRVITHYLQQQCHVDQLLETWECCLMPQLCHDLFELFDWVAYSPLHIHWSILHPPAHPSKIQFTFCMLNVYSILVIIIFSPPTCIQNHQQNCATILSKESSNSALPKFFMTIKHFGALGAIKARSYGHEHQSNCLVILCWRKTAEKRFI
jgi:hypothetical protein